MRMGNRTKGGNGEMGKQKTAKGEKAKRGKGETKNRGTLSERFALLLHLPVYPRSV